MFNIAIDKKLHFLAQALLMSYLYILTQDFIVSAAITFIVGLLKEVAWDYLLKKGTPDIYDMVANVAGISSSILIIFVGDI